MGLWIESGDATRAKLVNLFSVTLGGSIAGQPWKIKFGIGQAKAREKDATDGPATRPGMPDHGLAGLATEPSFGYAECRQVTPADEGAGQPEPFGGSVRPPLPRVSMDKNGSRANFWRSLHPDQQDAFMAMADRRAFAAGARLMQEGEQANHVVVILDGWTEIRVREHDGERVVARRGPGQLVGERAALQVSVRSATVVAIQPVDALVVHTEDFAAFVSDHPGVLDIVENQIFSRLRERPAAYERAGYGPDRGFDEATMAITTRRSGNHARTAGPPPRQQRLIGENCTILRTDVVAFSADKGEKLWSAKLLPGIANPVTYMLDGKQYVSVLSGRGGKARIYTFALDANMPIPGRPAGFSDNPFGPPPPAGGAPARAPNAPAAPTAPTTTNPNGTAETH